MLLCKEKEGRKKDVVSEMRIARLLSTSVLIMEGESFWHACQEVYLLRSSPEAKRFSSRQTSGRNVFCEALIFARVYPLD